MHARGLLAAALAVAASHGLLRSRRAVRLDRALGAAIARPLGHVADTVVAAATDLGSLYGAAGLAAVLRVAGRRRAAADVAGAALVAWTAAQAAKPVARRPRPYQVDGAPRLVAEPSGSSWPSGHTAVAAAVAAALAPELPRAGRRAAAGLTGFVALSRIYVGVHYVSDVVAGLGVGAWSAAAWRWARRLRPGCRGAARP